MTKSFFFSLCRNWVSRKNWAKLEESVEFEFVDGFLHFGAYNDFLESFDKFGQAIWKQRKTWIVKKIEYIRRLKFIREMMKAHWKMIKVQWMMIKAQWKMTKAHWTFIKAQWMMIKAYWKNIEADSKMTIKAQRKMMKI